MGWATPPRTEHNQQTTGRGAKHSYSTSIAIAPISHLPGIVNTTRETWPRRWSITALLVFPGGALALLTVELWWYREHLATGAVSSSQRREQSWVVRPVIIYLVPGNRHKYYRKKKRSPYYMYDVGSCLHPPRWLEWVNNNLYILNSSINSPRLF